MGSLDNSAIGLGARPAAAPHFAAQITAQNSSQTDIQAEDTGWRRGCL